MSAFTMVDIHGSTRRQPPVVAKPADPAVAVLIDPEPTHLRLIDIGQQHCRGVHRRLHRPPRDSVRRQRPPPPARPESITAANAAVLNRVVQRDRVGSCVVAWVNVRRRHAGSAHTSLGLRTTTSIRPAYGTSRTRCSVQACTRDDITPHVWAAVGKVV